MEGGFASVFPAVSAKEVARIRCWSLGRLILTFPFSLELVKAAKVSSLEKFL